MTTTAKRPSTARKVTPRSEANRQSALNEGVRLTLDGEVFTLRIGDVSPALAREVRKVTGRSFNSLLQDITTDPDIDVIAEAIWVARRINGDTLTLDEVILDYEILFSDRFEIAEAGEPTADEVEPDPKI